ncbi:MAG TPA: alpha/beta fold hydrolase [Bryobacteraceae bacterium]|nr:alpha/beta fold hydrolase [Bryobacteraceae bacterium]
MKNNSAFRGLLAPVLAVCVFLPGMAGMWWRYYFEFSEPQPPSLSGTLQTGRVKVGGLERRFSFYVPLRLSGNAPLLVALHGANSSGQKLRRFTGYEFESLADRHGFVVVYPDSFAGSWNDCRVASYNTARRQGIDDVGFVKAVIANLQARYGGQRPVYVLGYSTGGLMVYRLAVEAPETFTAAAAISANLPVDGNSDCAPARTPVSIAIVNGTADQINPFDGGNPHSVWTMNLGAVQSAEQSARYFAALAGHANKPRVERLPDRSHHASTWAERSTWSCGKANIELLAIHGGGHTISQPFVRQPRILGPTSTDIDAPAEVWRFFTQPAETVALAHTGREAGGR